MDKLKVRFPIYSKLLLLYPKTYRQQYGEQTLQTLADMLDNADGRPARSLIRLRAWFDLPLSIGKQQLIYSGGIMKTETPQYVKQSALIGAALLAPFFIVIISNSLSNHRLANLNSWKHFFLLSLVVLPAIAFLLNLLTFIRWAAERRQKNRASLLKSLFDIRHNWPTLVVTGLAFLIVLFVPFHDSTRCVTGNPVSELRNWHTTMRCIQNG